MLKYNEFQTEKKAMLPCEKIGRLRKKKQHSKLKRIKMFSNVGGSGYYE
jgi:hypothetical protein